MQSSANIWLAERCALKGPGSLMFRYGLSAKPVLRCTLPVKVLCFSRLLRELSSLFSYKLCRVHVSLQPPLPCSLGRPPLSNLPFLFTIYRFWTKREKNEFGWESQLPCDGDWWAGRVLSCIFIYLACESMYVCAHTCVCVYMFLPMCQCTWRPVVKFLAFPSILGLEVYFMLIYLLFFVYEYVWPVCLVPTEVRRGHQISWDWN